LNQTVAEIRAGFVMPDRDWPAPKIAGHSGNAGARTGTSASLVVRAGGTLAGEVLRARGVAQNQPGRRLISGRESISIIWPASCSSSTG